MKTIDAKNRSIGRVASEAAKALMGKDSVDFKNNAVKSEKVQIVNASKAKISQKKLLDKVYTRYTGYAGGLRSESLEKLLEKKGHTEVFRKAVSGMLPNNKLKKARIKNLVIID